MRRSHVDINIFWVLRMWHTKEGHQYSIAGGAGHAGDLYLVIQQPQTAVCKSIGKTCGQYSPMGSQHAVVTVHGPHAKWLLIRSNYMKLRWQFLPPPPPHPNHCCRQPRRHLHPRNLRGEFATTQTNIGNARTGSTHNPCMNSTILHIEERHFG